LREEIHRRLVFLDAVETSRGCHSEVAEEFRRPVGLEIRERQWQSAEGSIAPRIHVHYYGTQQSAVHGLIPTLNSGELAFAD
jgi:hypothetical protein